MNSVEKTARTVDDAITEALIELGTTSDQVNIQIINKCATGLLSIFSNRLAKVKVSKKINLNDIAFKFLEDIFTAMKLKVNIRIEKNDEHSLYIELTGPSMGVLIGKRGQTLDSLQYLLSLVVNRESEKYIRIKLDTENYRARRKETLENLAKNLAYKVKKSGKKFILEPMNPYERRIIHSILQNDKNVSTHSEGEEPYRKVVITLNRKS